MKKSDITILCVDDEPDILEILKYNLSNEGYNVFTANDGLSAISKAKEIIPNLIIMDIMMPNMDGIEVCEKIKSDPSNKNTFICFLTARNEDYSQIAGLEAGADDYVAKPIKPKVLISRINAILRRREMNLPNSDQSGIQINREKYVVVKNGKEIQLPKKEFELLSLLFSKPNFVFRREEILNHVWGTDIIVGDRTIDVHIRKLREKLGDHHIATVKGIGYKFIT